MTNENARLWLQENGFDTDHLDKCRKRGLSECTALAYASSRGNLCACKYIYSKGHVSQLRKSDTFGTTPLKLACAAGHLEVCKWLYSHGCSSDLRISDVSGLTPLNWACVNGHLKVVKWCIINGALAADSSSSNPGSRLLVYKFICGGIPERSPGLVDLLVNWAQLSLGESAVFRRVVLVGVSSERCKSSPLSLIGGCSGLAVLIADYCGIVYGRRLRNVRCFEELVLSITSNCCPFDLNLRPCLESTDPTPPDHISAYQRCVCS
jgi:hypothetical protein